MNGLLAKISNNACHRFIFVLVYFSMFTLWIVCGARKREWKLASDIFLTESLLTGSFLMVFSQVEILLKLVHQNWTLNAINNNNCIQNQILLNYIFLSSAWMKINNWFNILRIKALIQRMQKTWLYNNWS